MERPWRRVGVLGGTFDPVHIGHLATAVEVRSTLELDVVLLVVANVPWQKVGDRAVTDAPERLALVELAVEGLEGVVASDIELARGGESYTVDTVTELTAQHPGMEIVVIVGADAAAGLETWVRWRELRDAASVAVVARPGVPTPVLDGWRVVTVDVPALEVSSSDLRARVAAGRPIDVLVPAAVVHRIAERGLYAG